MPMADVKESRAPDVGPLSQVKGDVLQILAKAKRWQGPRDGTDRRASSPGE